MKTGNIKVNIVDGRRNWLPSPHSVLLQLWRNGTELAHEHFYDANSITVSFEVHDNTSDQFRVVAFADGYSQSGLHPVDLKAGETVPVYLMLIPKEGRPDFTEARPGNLAANGPQLEELLRRSSAMAEFDALRDSQLECAGLLNITTAMNDIELLPKHPLRYFTKILWENPPGKDRGRPQPDRFFGFAEPELLVEIKKQLGNQFSEEKDPARKGHPGATCSFKQNSFGEANLQLTFHENTKDGNNIMVEADLDFFKDQFAHFFLEVIPNKITGGKTNPFAMYVLRWMAARQKGLTFSPPYRIVEKP